MEREFAYADVDDPDDPGKDRAMGQHHNDVGVDIAKANPTLLESQLLALQIVEANKRQAEN